MKTTFLVTVLPLVAAWGLWAQGAGRPEAVWPRDPASGDSLPSESIQVAIDELEREITLSHDEMIGRMPEDVRKEILSCKTREDLEMMSHASQAWLFEKAGQIRTLGLAKAVEHLETKIELAGDDYCGILRETFWSRLHGKPFDLEEMIGDYLLYWKEDSVPEAKVSPLGLGKIEWLWRLDVKERRHGVMHVGMDVERRTFICYERTVGIYFPEGDKLERIYREIVQDPGVAGDKTGRGRVKGSGASGPESSDGLRTIVRRMDGLPLRMDKEAGFPSKEAAEPHIIDVKDLLAMWGVDTPDGGFIRYNPMCGTLACHLDEKGRARLEGFFDDLHELESVIEIGRAYVAMLKPLSDRERVATALRTGFLPDPVVAAMLGKLRHLKNPPFSSNTDKEGKSGQVLSQRELEEYEDLVAKVLGRSLEKLAVQLEDLDKKHGRPHRKEDRDTAQPSSPNGRLNPTTP